MICHRYHIDRKISGPERYHLAEALEDEYIPLTTQVPIWELAEKIRTGHFHFEHESDEPLEEFDRNFEALSAYLPQIVKGFHAQERIEETPRLIEARKILARRGEVVSIPLRLPPSRLLNDLDPGAEDIGHIESVWAEYPLWFQDGMRRKFPYLRRL
ncbi:MAG: hypothetical protein VCF07_07615 [Nitrospinota bacterium]